MPQRLFSPALVVAIVLMGTGLVFAMGPAPVVADLGRFQTELALYNYTADQFSVIQDAELRFRHDISRERIPAVRAGVREYLARYPHVDPKCTWTMRWWLCEVDSLSNRLGMTDAPSLDSIVARLNGLGHDSDAPRHARAAVRAEALGIVLDRARASAVSPEAWKTLGDQINALQKEYGPSLPGISLTYGEYDFALGLRTLYKYKSKPFELNFNGLDGAPVDIAKWRGKVVLLNFWATWCGGCIEEMPKLKELYQKNHGRGLELVGVSLDEDKTAAEKFVSSHGVLWPQDVAGKGRADEFRNRFGLHGIPALWLIDRHGMLVTMNGRDDMDGQVAKLLAAP